MLPARQAFTWSAYASACGWTSPRTASGKLPKVSGLEVLQAIRKDERTRLIPVVVLTSSSEQRDIVDTYKLGVNSYIQKPVDFEQFSQTIRRMGFYWLLINKVPES